MVKRLTNRADCVFTGKGLSHGGSLLRPEATGYGLVYFVQAMLATQGRSLEGMRVGVSGSGNDATHAIAKVLTMGGRVVSASDSDGTVVDEEGFTPEKLALLAEVKSDRRGRVSDYAARVKARFLARTKPWSIPMDVALPCATQNELDAEDAATLIRTGVTCVAEGANMPCTADAVKAFESAGVLYAPGKASNAGGVATSGLEMSQNAIRLAWTADEVDQRLRQIVHGIHDACVEHGGRPGGRASYVDGANIAGFARVAGAMRAQGVF